VISSMYMWCSLGVVETEHELLAPYYG